MNLLAPCKEKQTDVSHRAANLSRFDKKIYLIGWRRRDLRLSFKLMFEVRGLRFWGLTFPGGDIYHVELRMVRTLLRMNALPFSL